MYIEHCKYLFNTMGTAATVKPLLLCSFNTECVNTTGLIQRCRYSFDTTNSFNTMKANPRLIGARVNTVQAKAIWYALIQQ